MHNESTLAAAKAAVELQQRELVAAIFPQRRPSPRTGDIGHDGLDRRGLKIYQNNLLLTARQALAISFPTVVQLIGEDVFNHASKTLLVESPPCEGDWGLWGDKLPTVLASLTALSEYPFVADIARLDWFRHCTMRAQDNQVDQQSLQLLATVELDELYIDYSDSVFLMHSVFPIMEFWQANQPNSSTTDSSEQLLAQALDKLQRSDFEQHLLIYRPHYRAEIREPPAIEQQWLEKTMQGISIGKTLDVLDRDDFDFAQWLGNALQQNLIHSLKQ